MRRISYELFVNYGRSVGAVTERDNRIEITFTPPTVSDAAETGDVDEVPPVYVIVAERKGDEVEVQEVKIESEKGKRYLTAEEIEFWVESVFRE
ncbi:hypothetical protein HS7_02450 [Sulfolobales archaeon HS-7]|nr:hypothetical protein HS7_02450 [Sulfolobales archaeon HS-7]